MEKGKGKGISLLTGSRGNFGPVGPREHARGQAAQLGPLAGDGAVGAGPRFRGRRGGGNGVGGGGRRSAAMRTGRW
jgi:hypothetical protein